MAYTPAPLRGAGTTAPGATAGVHLSAAAKSALALCEEEALGSGLGLIETDHLLLGLLRQGEGRAGKVLRGLSISLEAARQAASELRSGCGPVLAAELLEGYDYRVALLQAAGAVGVHGGWLDTEHLLRSALTARAGAAARLLKRLGVEPDRVVEALLAPARDPEP